MKNSRIKGPRAPALSIYDSRVTSVSLSSSYVAPRRKNRGFFCAQCSRVLYCVGTGVRRADCAKIARNFIVPRTTVRAARWSLYLYFLRGVRRMPCCCSLVVSCGERDSYLESALTMVSYIYVIYVRRGNCRRVSSNLHIIYNSPALTDDGF